MFVPSRLLRADFSLAPGVFTCCHKCTTSCSEKLPLVTEGTGEISLMGQASAAGPGALMDAAPNDLHGIHDTGAAPLTFYFNKLIAAGVSRKSRGLLPD